MRTLRWFLKQCVLKGPSDDITEETQKKGGKGLRERGKKERETERGEKKRESERE